MVHFLRDNKVGKTSSFYMNLSSRQCLENLDAWLLDCFRFLYLPNMLKIRLKIEAIYYFHTEHTCKDHSEDKYARSLSQNSLPFQRVLTFCLFSDENIIFQRLVWSRAHMCAVFELVAGFSFFALNTWRSLGRIYQPIGQLSQDMRKASNYTKTEAVCSFYL